MPQRAWRQRHGHLHELHQLNLANDHIRMLPFEEKLAHHFSRLNTQWLQRYFQLELADMEMLNNPESYFISKGGLIFFAAINN